MKKLLSAILICAMLLSLAACAASPKDGPEAPEKPSPNEAPTGGGEKEEPSTPAPDAPTVPGDAIDIVLSDEGIETSADAAAVYTGKDIIYYEAGKDETYGEGTEADAHTAEEAAAHTVVHIAAPGTYRLKGKLSAGQIFVDLGEDAKEDPNAVVNLILDGVDVTCTVAPAILFYQAYECCDDETATTKPDTLAAGANVFLADGSVNNVKGAYIARIYKEGTTDKLHKYDAAFHSRVTMNVVGNDGTLNITAANEGLDSELHLSIWGGKITINAQNDGINTNEDGISVTTIHGGDIAIHGGFGVEGDGIDSNGCLVVNGGTLYATANERGVEGAIDADLDILLNGGTVIAAGMANGMASADSAQEYMELTFAQSVSAGSTVELLEGEQVLLSFTTERAMASLTLSCKELALNVPYTLKVNGKLQQYTAASAGGMMGGFGGMQGGQMGGQMQMEGLTPPEGLDEWLESAEVPEEIRSWIEAMRDMAQQGAGPQGMPEGMEPPEGMPGEGAGDMGGQMPQGMGGGRGDEPQGFGGQMTGGSTEFILTENAHSFSGVGDGT